MAIVRSIAFVSLLAAAFTAQRISERRHRAMSLALIVCVVSAFLATQTKDWPLAVDYAVAVAPAAAVGAGCLVAGLGLGLRWFFPWMMALVVGGTCAVVGWPESRFTLMGGFWIVCGFLGFVGLLGTDSPVVTLRVMIALTIGLFVEGLGWISIAASYEAFQFARWISIVTLWVITAVQIWATWPVSWGIIGFRRGKVLWYLPGEGDQLKEIDEFLSQVRNTRATQCPIEEKQRTGKR